MATKLVLTALRHVWNSREPTYFEYVLAFDEWYVIMQSCADREFKNGSG
jgi:hypothetical protein